LSCVQVTKYNEKTFSKATPQTIDRQNTINLTAMNKKKYAYSIEK